MDDMREADMKCKVLLCAFRLFFHSRLIIVRAYEGHRAQIQEHFAFREATVLDTEEMKTWRAKSRNDGE